MKHLFVPYEIALALKEKGFEFDDDHYWVFGKYVVGYQDEGVQPNAPYVSHQTESADYLFAPLYQQVVDWFREKHDIIIEVQLDCTSYIKFCISVVKFREVSVFTSAPIAPRKWGLYRNYYEALTVAIEEALKLI